MPSDWYELNQFLNEWMSVPVGGDEISIPAALSLMDNHSDCGQAAEVLAALNQVFNTVAATGAQALTYNPQKYEALKYADAVEAVNKRTECSTEMISALLTVSWQQLRPLTQRYYRLKARLLGLEQLRWYDRLANLSRRNAISFSAAKAMALQGIRAYSPMLATYAKQQLDSGRVHHNQGRDGSIQARATFVIKNKQAVPETFMPFFGTYRDVYVLAHELGHNIHALCAHEKNERNAYDTPRAICEAYASLCGTFVNERLLQAARISGDRTRLISLLMNRIDDFIISTVRQLSISYFETRNAFHDGPQLDRQTVQRHWVESIEQFFSPDGKTFDLTNAENLWLVISYLDTPWTSSCYVVAGMLTEWIYREYVRHGPAFDDRLLHAMQQPPCYSPYEHIKPLGLTESMMSSEKFWRELIADNIESLVDELEGLT